MTENPGNPAGVGGQPPEYSAPPVPPPADYSAQPAGYPPPAPPQPPYQQPQYQPPAPGGAHSVGQQFSSFDPKTLQNFDPKTVSPLDWGIIAAGLIAFIFSTFSFYTYSVSFSIAGLSNSASTSWSAWHGFFGWFGVLLALAAAIVLAVQLIAKIEMPFPTRLVVLGAFAVATLCLLLALVVVPGNTGGAGAFGVKINKGHGIGYWITLLAVLAGTGLAVKRFTDTGGKLPKRP
ncbi:MAG: hypothetical protein ABI140_20010 [Jatrophihabitantaceae bacterium]